jgi:acetoin utilization deacetylase AcuC-like enzyme
VTFSIHQEDIYPNKERSDIDIGLGRGIADNEYLEILEKGLEELSAFALGELVMVVAGVDPLATDSLGHLMLSKDGIYKRDHMVLKWASRKNVAIAFTLGGGYSQRLLNTIDAHIGTLHAILEP